MDNKELDKTLKDLETKMQDKMAIVKAVDTVSKSQWWQAWNEYKQISETYRTLLNVRYNL